jgi:hypothetical protein
MSSFDISLSIRDFYVLDLEPSAFELTFGTFPLSFLKFEATRFY